MTDLNRRLVGRGVVLGFVAVLVVASFSVGVTAAKDTVTIHESVAGAEISVASDGQTVYIRASDGATDGTTTDTVTADVGSGTLSVTVRDNGLGDDDDADDGVYWGNFTITSGTTDASTNTISVGDGNSVSASVDLDGQGDGGSASLTADYTAPDLSSAATAGTDASGNVDEINVTFNESVADSTVAAGDFSLSTGTVDSVSTGDTADDENVTLTVSGLSGTDATPDVTLAAGGVEDEAGNSIGSDSTVTSTDGTAPIQIGNRYDDVNGDGTVDTLKVTFSEPVDGSTFVDDDWSVGVAGDPNVSAPRDVRIGSTTSEVLINVTADENVTGRQTSSVSNPRVSLSGTSVQDAAGNPAQQQSKNYVDVADPSMKSIEYLDTDGDGTVDRIDVTFTEFIDDTKSSGADAADFTISGTDSSDVTKGTLTIPDTSDNTEAQLGVTGPTDDTGLALELAYTGSKIEDARSNIASQFSATTVDDSAAPVVSSFSLSADDANEELDVSFDATESLSTISVSVSGPESNTLTSFSQSGATYSASLSVSTSGDYTATLDTADDSAGNGISSSPASTASITISTPTPTPTPTATAKSSGGRDRKSNPSALSDTSSRVRLQGTTGLSEVGVRFSGARAGTIRAVEITSLTPPAPPGQFVAAVDITVADSLTETPSTLKFAIARDRLDDLGVSPGDLTVYRRHDGEWRALETRVVDRGSDTIVVEADTPGFSRFAVMAGSGASQETSTATSDSSAPTETPTSDSTETTETPEAVDDTPVETDGQSTVTETETPGFGVGVALVALVAALLVGLRRRD